VRAVDDPTAESARVHQPVLFACRRLARSHDLSIQLTLHVESAIATVSRTSTPAMAAC
jgi:hypothetical protein